MYAYNMCLCIAEFKLFDEAEREVELTEKLATKIKVAIQAHLTTWLIGLWHIYLS